MDRLLKLAHSRPVAIAYGLLVAAAYVLGIIPDDVAMRLGTVGVGVLLGSPLPMPKAPASK